MLTNASIFFDWKNTLERKFIRSIIYHDYIPRNKENQSRRWYRSKNMQDKDVIFTTFGILVRELNDNKIDSPLAKIQLHRVILDKVPILNKKNAEVSLALC